MEKNDFIAYYKGTRECLEEVALYLQELGFNVEKAQYLPSLNLGTYRCSYEGDSLDSLVKYAGLHDIKIENNKTVSIKK